MSNSKIIARWQSKGGKYFFDLKQYDWNGFTSYEYTENNGGGTMGDTRHGMNRENAFLRAQELLSYFPSQMIRTI